MIRPDWDNYFMKMAEVAASRGTCDRKQVGAVIVLDKQVLATGYNGAAAGMPNCSVGPHECDPDQGFGYVLCKHCGQTAFNKMGFIDIRPLLFTPCEKNPGVGHDMQDGHCVRTVHAEMNAVAQAAKHGVSINNATVYTTASPCWDCFRVCVNAGIRKFIFKEAYRTDENAERIKAVCATIGVEVKQL